MPLYLNCFCSIVTQCIPLSDIFSHFHWPEIESLSVKCIYWILVVFIIIGMRIDKFLDGPFNTDNSSSKWGVGNTVNTGRLEVCKGKTKHRYTGMLGYGYWSLKNMTVSKNINVKPLLYRKIAAEKLESSRSRRYSRQLRKSL